MTSTDQAPNFVTPLNHDGPIFIGGSGIGPSINPLFPRQSPPLHAGIGSPTYITGVPGF